MPLLTPFNCASSISRARFPKIIFSKTTEAKAAFLGEIPSSLCGPASKDFAFPNRVFAATRSACSFSLVPFCQHIRSSAPAVQVPSSWIPLLGLDCKSVFNFRSLCLILRFFCNPVFQGLERFSCTVFLQPSIVLG